MSSIALPLSVSSDRAIDAPTPFRLGYRPGLDGLRAIAILLVLAVHLDRLEVLPFSLVSSGLGVDLFFVISGFLITSILFEEYSTAGEISLTRFYTRRALRLLPALLALLAVICVAAITLGSLASLNLTPLRLTSTIGYFSNWVRAYESWGDVWILAHFWSLSIEEQFYFLWPVALLAMLKLRLSQRVIISIAVAAIASSVVVRFVLYLDHATTERLYHGSDTRADALLIGCLLSLALHFGYAKVEKLLSLFPAAVIIFLSLAYATTQQTGFMYLGGLTIAALAAAIILLRAVLDPLPVFTSSTMLWIGQRSYGLYLWHWPVYEASRLLPPALILPCAIFGTFAIATLSYRYVETPFLRKKAALTRA